MRKKADYNPSEYFCDEYEQEQAERNEALSGNIGNYRTKTTKCGSKYCEVDIYPNMKWGVKRENPRGKTSEVQRKINHKNVKRKIIQLLNANFWNLSNIWATLTYSKNLLPADYAEANKNLANYFRKLKRLIERVNEMYWEMRQESFLPQEREKITRTAFETALFEYQAGKRLKANFALIAEYLARTLDKPLEPLKYLLVTEVGSKGQYHHHIIMNFPDRDVIECFWKFGKYNHTRRIKPDEDFGLSGLAAYISKDYGYKKEYEKSFRYSQNLVRPYQKGNYTTSDYKASKKQAAEIANDIVKAQAWFAKKYPDYELLETPEVRTNDYFGGYWIYARLRKKTAEDNARDRARENARAASFERLIGGAG